MMGTSFDSRRLLACCILFAGAIGFLFVLLNFPSNMVRMSTREFGNPVGSVELFSRGTVTQIEKAGWPLTYQVRFIPHSNSDDSSDALIRTLYYSSTSLSCNVLLGLVAMMGVALLTALRHRQISRSTNPHRTQRFYDVGTAAMCLAVPAIMYGISWSTANRHMRVAASLANFGQCTLSSELPDWIAKRLPNNFATAFLRITDVQLTGPGEDIFARFKSIDTLRNVQIHRANVDPGDLAFLNQSKTLQWLSLTSCRIASESIEDVSRLENLRWLSLAGSPLQSSDLKTLDRLTNLEGVNLSRTRIRLSDFEQPGWSRCVRRLQLSRPQANQSDRLQLKNWSKLTELIVQRLEPISNEATLTLDLADCPELTKVYLDRWQKHALVGSNLPKLKSFVEPVEFLINDPLINVLPAMTRWEKLDLTNLPSLTLLECQGSDLEYLRLSNLPHLRKVALGNSFFEKRDRELLTKPDADHDGKVFVEAISQIPSINHVNIQNVRLDKSDLTQLCAIPYLRELHCINTGLCNRDLEPLESKESLRYLDLGQCDVSEQRLNRLVSLPNLKTIHANLSRIQQLHISEHVRIEGLISRPLLKLRSLDLNQLPRFSGGIAIQNQVDRLQVRSVPLLRELIVECLWPPNYALDDLRGLQRFAGGGSEMRDDVLDELCDCRALDQLTLAYPQIAQANFFKIGQMKMLTSLELPGCPVDDQVVMRWNRLKRLRRVCLDDTAIGEGTMRWLARQESLRSLSLNHLTLDGPSQRSLATLEQVSDLSLVETEIEDQAFVDLMNNHTIEFIDLSKTSLSEAKINAIASSRSLKFCALSDCGLTSESLRKLLDSNLRLQIEFNENESLANSSWTPADRSRIHLASEGGQWSRRMGQQHRSTISSILPVSSDDKAVAGNGGLPDVDSEERELNTRLVNRPFSLALFRDFSNR